MTRIDVRTTPELLHHHGDELVVMGQLTSSAPRIPGVGPDAPDPDVPAYARAGGVFQCTGCAERITVDIQIAVSWTSFPTDPTSGTPDKP